MAYSPSLNTFLVLLLASMVKAADFRYCFDLIFTKAFYDSSDAKVKQDTTRFASTDPAQLNSAVEPAFSCSSVYMNNFSWRWLINFTPCDTSYMSVGLWVNFQSTLSQEVIKIGNSAFNSKSYIAKSTTEGTLNFDYIDASGTTASNSFSFNVPINSWIFLVVNWENGYTYILMFGQNYSKKTRTGNYNNPTGGVVGFGYGVRAFLYEISWFSSAGIHSSYTIIYAYDSSGIKKSIDGTCTGACSYSWCHPIQKCWSLAVACTSCDSAGCITCGTTNKDPATFCNTCPQPLYNNICNFYLGCSSNCEKCTATTVCTQCKSGYFLYDKAGVTSCIGNFYLACSTSCSSCTTAPDCFECATSIVKDGSTCRTDSVGYQIGFSAPNIELDFAHPLVSTLTKDSIKVTRDDGAAIDTSSWTLNSCVAGVLSCTITTNNLSPSQLPVDIELEFNQA